MILDRLEEYLKNRTKREIYLIFLGSFLAIFYLFYGLAELCDELYTSSLERHKSQLNQQIAQNSPAELQNKLNMAGKKLVLLKEELGELGAESEFLSAHIKSLPQMLFKFSSNNDIINFISTKAKEAQVHIINISQNPAPNSKESVQKIYDFNISFNSGFLEALKFIDALHSASVLFNIEDASLEPSKTELNLIAWGIR